MSKPDASPAAVNSHASLVERVAKLEAALREIADINKCAGVPVDSEACAFFANTVNEIQAVAQSALAE